MEWSHFCQQKFLLRRQDSSLQELRDGWAKAFRSLLFQPPPILSLSSLTIANFRREFCPFSSYRMVGMQNPLQRYAPSILRIPTHARRYRLRPPIYFWSWQTWHRLLGQSPKIIVIVQSCRYYVMILFCSRATYELKPYLAVDFTSSITTVALQDGAEVCLYCCYLRLYC